MARTALATGVVVLFVVSMYFLGRASVREVPLVEPRSEETNVEAARIEPLEAAAAAEAVSEPEPEPPAATGSARIRAARELSEPTADPAPSRRAGRSLRATQGDAGESEAEDSSAVLPDGRSLQLGGIASSASEKIALINGRTVARGETVEGFRVVAIDRGRVELRSNGEVITLRLKAQGSLQRATGHALVDAARHSILTAPRYDPSYAVIDYPLGDPGLDRGAGVDLVVRAFRQLGIDLQQRIQEDIRQSDGAYGLREPDPNIDHRRIRNQGIFFARNAIELPTTREGDWRAGDIVLWDLTGDRLPEHIGIISDRTTAAGVPLVIHHMRPGRGFDGRPGEDDVLFRWPASHHFRWPPDATTE